MAIWLSLDRSIKHRSLHARGKAEIKAFSPQLHIRNRKERKKERRPPGSRGALILGHVDTA